MGHVIDYSLGHQTEPYYITVEFSCSVIIWSLEFTLKRSRSREEDDRSQRSEDKLKCQQLVHRDL